MTLLGGVAGASYLLAATVAIENDGDDSILANCSLLASGIDSFRDVSVTVPGRGLNYPGFANASLLGSVTVTANDKVPVTVECITFPNGGKTQSMTLTATRVGTLPVQP